jgi:hypothetical protein
MPGSAWTAAVRRIEPSSSPSVLDLQGVGEDPARFGQEGQAQLCLLVFGFPGLWKRALLAQPSSPTTIKDIPTGAWACLTRSLADRSGKLGERMTRRGAGAS